jgi:hypothetical protein
MDMTELNFWNMVAMTAMALLCVVTGLAVTLIGYAWSQSLKHLADAHASLSFSVNKHFEDDKIEFSNTREKMEQINVRLYENRQIFSEKIDDSRNEILKHISGRWTDTGAQT